MGLSDKIKDAAKEIEEKTTAAIEKAKADGSLREHKGEPLKKGKK